jgi:ribonuclease HII
MLIAGIDEAGRGCVIGPLVIAGVLFKHETLEDLKQLGVKDSKLLTARERESLFPQILHVSKNHVILKLQPKQIDIVVNSGRKLHKLNRLEAENMAQIINRLQPDEAQVDAADVLEERFKHHIQEHLIARTTVVSEHKADRHYPAVSAASIVAKVTRDKEIAALAAKYGDFGTGYLTDKKTDAFLKQLLKDRDEYPDFVRKSWKPAKRAKAEKTTRQQTLI